MMAATKKRTAVNQNIDAVAVWLLAKIRDARKPESWHPHLSWLNYWERVIWLHVDENAARPVEHFELDPDMIGLIDRTNEYLNHDQLPKKCQTYQARHDFIVHAIRNYCGLLLSDKTLKHTGESENILNDIEQDLSEHTRKEYEAVMSIPGMPDYESPAKYMKRIEPEEPTTQPPEIEDRTGKEFQKPIKRNTPPTERERHKYNLSHMHIARQLQETIRRIQRIEANDPYYKCKCLNPEELDWWEDAIRKLIKEWRQNSKETLLLDEETRAALDEQRTNRLNDYGNRQLFALRAIKECCRAWAERDSKSDVTIDNFTVEIRPKTEDELFAEYIVRQQSDSD